MYISNATFINVTFRAFLIKFETDVNEIYYLYLFIFDMQSVFLVCYHLFLRHVIDSHSKGTLRTDLLWKESWISNSTTNSTGCVSTIKQIISNRGNIMGSYINTLSNHNLVEDRFESHDCPFKKDYADLKRQSLETCTCSYKINLSFAKLRAELIFEGKLLIE